MVCNSFFGVGHLYPLQALSFPEEPGEDQEAEGTPARLGPFFGATKIFLSPPEAGSPPVFAPVAGFCYSGPEMEFTPLYFQDRLSIINPRGSVGVVTLWSKVDYVVERFREAGVDLDRKTSPIAAFGNLYGNGLREMLRNLLYNPQVQVLLVCGHDRSGSREELENFFVRGLEPVPRSIVRYRSPEPDMVVSPVRIRGTKRLMDDLVRPEFFARPPRRVWLGDPGEEATGARIREFFGACRLEEVPALARQQVPLPEVEVQYFPSNPRAHQVVKDTPLEAWKEVLYLLTRFGRRVTLKKGERLELQHVKVVVEKPKFETEEKLLAAHLDPERLWRYQAEILKGELRPDETYHYGHRLRAHFGLDTLTACVARLKEDPEDRKSYVTLWDNPRDLSAAEGRPCLVSLFFRKFEGKLTLSATFRTHNALDAWLLNVYGLMAIQGWVAERVGLPPGAIIVVSHSLGLDPRELDRALTVVDKRPWKMRLDLMGYFRVSLNGSEILVEHRFEDVTLKEYRGRTAISLQHQVARDLALSDLNHAIYLGRQLAKAEMALKEGRPYEQD
jgi:thymidylate synthase